MTEVRLQKVLAQAGVASRRRCEEFMQQGRVEVDGEIVTQMGARVDPATAVIRVDGKRLPPPSDHVYLCLNKPVGVISTMSDPQGRPTIGDLVERRSERLFHVGRLDTDTEGLILLTNHGDLAHRLAHPSYEVVKTYIAEVEGHVRPKIGAQLRQGIELDDGPVTVDRFIVKDARPGRSLVQLDIHEGRNRIVRRMLDAVGHPVTKLSRIAIGDLRLGQLRSGQLRDLTQDELGALLDSVGM